MSEHNPESVTWKTSRFSWVVIALASVFTYLAFRTGINYSANWIWERPEYGHGLIIPFIVAYLIWKKRPELSKLPFTGSWAGVGLLVFGVAVAIVGRMSALFIVQQYAAVIGFYGIVLALIGWRAFRLIAAPLFLVALMIPLPEFLYQNLSAKLQLISSQIGVGVIRLFGISVYLEGNVIDLGAFELQVAEACDGLRYLFPLMTISFIVAYFYSAPLWKRVLLFASSVPVTILMNSFRIGMIGLMVEHWGISMAEGFLHQFQGWMVFMLSLAILLLEARGLSWIGGRSRAWTESFSFDWGTDAPPTQNLRGRSIPASMWVASGVVLASYVSASLLSERSEALPGRTTFAEFPLHLGDWEGRKEPLGRIFLDQLKLDDYLLADFQRPGGKPVNFYVAWYDSQRAGASAHSPRSCIPAGGWQIKQMSQVLLPGVSYDGKPVRANRVLIQMGTEQQLVYYWFQQRGRVVTNEYMVKWLMFWDSLVRSRTDGALVRFTVPLNVNEPVELGDAEVRDLAAQAVGPLARFVPS